LMLIDPRAWVRQHDQKVLLCPDPVPPVVDIGQSAARSQLGIPTNGRLIVSVGNQDSRKGTDLLLSAFAESNLQPTDRLLVIGKIDGETKSICSEFASRENLVDRLIVRDEYVSDQTFQLAILASNVVAAPYRKTEGPSGVVSRAIGWNRPIVATNTGWLKWVCDQLEVGVSVNVHQTALFASAIQQALDASAEYKMTTAAKSFAAYNTQENYHRIWNQVVQDSPTTSSFLKPEFLIENAS